MADSSSISDELKYGSALLVAVVGLLVPAALVVFPTIKDWKVADISTIVGAFTTVVGTLVGAFLGVQVGSTGKQKAEDTARRALAALPPEIAKTIT